jgi:pimeloyl-ACP methyl ester carboxylesterase
MSGGTATINGAEIYWESAGSGPALVLLHAGIADCRMWDDLFITLSDDFRCIRYDLRGFGRSSFPGGPYSHVADLHALLRAVDIDSVALLGASFGGEVAIDFSLVYPRRVTRLVLAAPALGGYEWSRDVRQFGIEEDAALEAGDVERAVELNLRMWVDGPNRQASEVRGTVRERVREMQRVAFENQLRAYEQSPPPSPSHDLQPPAATRLSEIEVPTLAVVGEEDVPDFRTIAEQLSNEAPNARKVVVPGAAHMVPLERPEEFAHLTRAFLGESDST